MEKDGTISQYSKKIIANLMREKKKMLRNLRGLRHMKQLPAAVVVVDPKREHNCVHEARRLGVVTIALLDTDCSPGEVDFPVPGNDDAMKSIGVFLRVIADAAIEGRRLGGRDLPDEAPVAAAAAAE